MGRDTGIADRLRAAGLVVVEVDGWTERGNSSFSPEGSIDHHTAGSLNGVAPSLGICINGRGDLPGPLCNVFIDRVNVCYVVAAGRANHAGIPDGGNWNGLTGNTKVYGIERENRGTAEEPWREDQTEVAVRAHAALMEGKDANLVGGHKEWAPSRKIDAHALDYDDFRSRVAAAMGQPSPGPAPAPPPAPSGPRLLQQGMSGGDVRQLQHDLNVLTGAGLKEDGIFGPKTKQAVVAFQQAHGLAADGIVGPITRQAIQDGFAPAPPQAQAPPWPGRLFTYPPVTRGEDVEQWQAQMKARGWEVSVDGAYGPQSKAVCVAFQQEKGLDPDGIVGPRTWEAAWTAPVT